MEAVKPTRRRDRVATRARMVDAARSLFRDHGYARSTVVEIARVAGVAPQTVYWAFGSKARLVAEIREAWLTEARTGERLRTVLAEPDPDRRLDAYAAFMAHQWDTGAVAIAIQQEAMRVDPEVAADVSAVLESRATALLEVVRPLSDVLVGGMSIRAAHDRLLAISLVEVFAELRARGWSVAEYRDWLGATLRHQLLGR